MKKYSWKHNKEEGHNDYIKIKVSLIVLWIVIGLFVVAILKITSDRMLIKDCLQAQKWTLERDYVPSESFAKVCSEIGVNFKP